MSIAKSYSAQLIGLQAEIVNVEVIRVHSSLTKFQVLIKAKNVETVETIK